MSKRKGTSAERELVHRFWKEGWAAIRVAGSGSSTYPSPDIIAGKDGRSIALECKSTSDIRQYFTKKEISELKKYSSIMHAEPWVGVRFPGGDWFFLAIEDLNLTQKAFVISKEQAKQKGFLFQEFIRSF